MPYNQNYDLNGYQDQYNDYYGEQDQGQEPPGHHAHYAPYGIPIQNIPTTMGKTPPNTPKFAGKQTESVYLFFKQFKNVAKLQRWDEAMKLGMLSSCLKGDAAVWAASLPAHEALTYEDFKRNELSEYVDARMGQTFLL